MKTVSTAVSTLIPLQDIMLARKCLKGVINQTPTIRNFNLSKTYGCNIFLKREDLQVVRSFKIRGAYNKMKNMSKADLSGGIVCASAGNHAQGVAFACHLLNVRGTIFMPSVTPKQKVNKVKHFGDGNIDIILTGDTFDDAYVAAKEKAASDNLAFIHPFNDRQVIAGQATLGPEILEECDQDIDILIVSAGGGGLVAGIGSYFKQLSPKTQIIAVEAAGAPALQKSLEKGEIVELGEIDPFADGIAVRRLGEKSFEICKEVVDKVVVVPEGKICSSILQLYNDEAIVMEPAGAAAVAALDYIKDEIKGKNVVCLLSGGNNDIVRTEEIRERALLYEGRKHYFIIRFPQRAGALRDFLNVLGPDDDISHFEYTKKNNRETGPALVGIELQRNEDYHLLIDRMTKAHINFQHINNNRMLFEMLV